MDNRSELAKRIDDLIQSMGTRDAFAAKSGIPLSSLDRYCRGESEPPASRLGLIAQAGRVSTDYLIFGTPSTPLSANLPSEMGGVVLIPMIDVIASAGPGFENPTAYEIDRLPFPRAWLNRLGVPEKYARFLDSRGDSMEPTIMDGAIVLADTRHQTPTINGIYVVVDGGSVRIKRIAIGWMGALDLISDNERYPTESLKGPDAEALRVAGKVVWAGGEL